MAAAWSDNAYSVNLAQIALMLPIGTAVPQPRQRIGTTRITQKRREWPRQGYRRRWLPARRGFGGPDRDRTGDLL